MTDMIDMTDQDQLDILEKALWQYRSPMTLPAGVDPLATWQAVLQKNPSLQAYVKDVHMTAIPKGGYVLTVQYMNTNIHILYF